MNNNLTEHCLMQCSCFICSDLKFERFISKLESQPLITHR